MDSSVIIDLTPNNEIVITTDDDNEKICETFDEPVKKITKLRNNGTTDNSTKQDVVVTPIISNDKSASDDGRNSKPSSHSLGYRTIKLMTSTGALGGQLMVATSQNIATAKSVAIPVSAASGRGPVKFVVGENINHAFKLSSNSLKISSESDQVGGPKRKLLCLSPTSVAYSSAGGVANKPAQRLAVVMESPAKRFAVVSSASATAKSPFANLGKPVPTGIVLNKATSLAKSTDVDDVINLTESPVKIVRLSEEDFTSKVRMKPINIHPVAVQVSNPAGQIVRLPSKGITSTISRLASPISTVSSSNNFNTAAVKYVKLSTSLADPSFVLQNSSTMKILIPPFPKTTSECQTSKVVQNPILKMTTANISSQQVYKSTLPTSDRSAQPRIILPSNLNPSLNLTTEEMKSAVAHMTRQAALTMKEIEKTTNITMQKRDNNTIVIKPHQLNESDLRIVKNEPGLVASSKLKVVCVESAPMEKSRRPCNCSKSQCLKLYCECFANGEFCNSCNCINCANNLDHEDNRQRAIRSCLDRNPYAFHPKIGKNHEGNKVNRQHSKGCNCKRSFCLKNYCECYEAKILCTDLCRCCDCRNFESNFISKSLMRLADAAEVRVQQQQAASARLDVHIDDLPYKPVIDNKGKRLSHTFITVEVIDASTSCLLATAEECSVMCHSDKSTEQQLLEEFGRCLDQVIDAANRSTML